MFSYGPATTTRDEKQVDINAVKMVASGLFRPQSTSSPTTLDHETRRQKRNAHGQIATCLKMKLECVNDPSAGSPTAEIGI